MNLEERILAFNKIGSFLREDVYIEFKEQLNLAELTNPWFTQKNISDSFNSWSDQLNIDTLNAWLRPYKLNDSTKTKTVLIIMAGNIPLVGFHDFISVLLCGHKAVIKLSSNDNVLLKIIIKKLISIESKFNRQIAFIDNVRDKLFDAVISTSSNNSARYFEYYFKNTKRIVRKNRISVAILDGKESENDLKGLAVDVFSYFGLGCRNVSKIYLPRGYDLDIIFQAFFTYSILLEHTKYANNYDYYKSIFLLGKNKIIENGFLLLKEDPSFYSPVATLYYEYYDDISSVNQSLENHSEKIQCIISNKNISFGKSQKPNLWDYADGVDSIDFLKKL